MSLLRLLSAGKSLVGLKDGPARYRMSDPRLMPRFGSGGNPFVTPKAVETENLSEPAETQTTPPAHSKVVETAPKAETSAAPKTVPVARSQPWWKRWLGASGQKLRRLAPRRDSSPPRTRTRPGRSPVQGELSLDMVRVVRNDLSDSDFEVVARRPAAATVSPAVVLAPAPEPAEDRAGARSRMAKRLFCAGKT